MGMPERVMGTHKLGPQYQQQDGDWENITVLETIFKGSTYQVKWVQDNPANALWAWLFICCKLSLPFERLGYLKKGWTDGEIGVEWIKHFNKHTAAKAVGGIYWLLLVDGHNSYYTHNFLKYACTHQILVLCYLAHTTHVFQGINVVVFGVLKHFWTIKHDQHQQETRGKVDKSNFLGIYGRAHLCTMNPES